MWYSAIDKDGVPSKAVARLTPEQLLDAALNAVGGDEYKLAKRLELNLNTAATQFGRWRRGGGMNFETTIRLLEIAGLLKNG